MIIEAATAEQNSQLKPFIVANMAAELIDSGVDLSNLGAVALALHSNRHSAQCIAACMDEAILVATVMTEAIYGKDHSGRSRHQEIGDEGHADSRDA